MIRCQFTDKEIKAPNQGPKELSPGYTVNNKSDRQIKILICLTSKLKHFKFYLKSFGLLSENAINFFSRKFNFMNCASFKLMVMLIFILLKIHSLTARC